jgi:signal peptidase I
VTTQRVPLLALAAGLMLPGLGQVYCGEIARGLSILLGIAVLPTVTAWLGLHGPSPVLWLVVVLGALFGAALYAWSAFDAWRLARRTPERAGAWQRPVVYVLCALVAYLLLLGPMVGYARDNLLETFYAKSASMMPTLVPGDRFLADKRVNRPGGVALWRGAVALFIDPNDRVNVFVKRIIGLPGDRIEIDGTSIRVNDRELRGSEIRDLGDPLDNQVLDDHLAFRESGDRAEYVVLWRKDAPSSKASFEVPNGHIFVLGDNRTSSLDSRKFGVVPVADVKAVARQVVFSYQPGQRSRFSRMGTSIE